MSSSSDDLVEVAAEQSEDRDRADAADDVESSGNRKESSDTSDTSDTSGEVITAEQEYTDEVEETSEGTRHESAVEASEADGSETEPTYEVGMTLGTRELYRQDEDDEWDEWMPDDAGNASGDGTEDQKYAVVIRREKKRGKRGLFLHSITINSPLLRRVLDDVFDGYEGISTKLRELVFYPPLHEFYYRWHLFENTYLTEQDETTKEHLELLYTFMSGQILPHIATMEDLTKNHVISYDYLWAIFPPGMDVYSKVDDQDRLFSLERGVYQTFPVDYFELRCRYIDSDGTKFGYVSKTFDIYRFDGVKKITDLDVFPSHLHADLEALLERLDCRGERFEEMNGFNHVLYSGFYIDRSAERPRRRHVEDSRIIVDAHMFSVQNGGSNGLDPLDDESESPEDKETGFKGGIADVVYRATMNTFKEYEKLLRRFQQRKKISEYSSTLTARQRLLCNPMVRGFCLSSKKWAEFYVDNIRPIQWNEDVFEKLVLPNDYKEIIHAFVQNQLSCEDGFDDFVRGKGQGFIVLLSGEPGVGKTLTAEAVSEVMRKPLYSLSAGELGEQATEIEQSLESVLELTTKWGCILLLDECDIFLEERTTSDIQRNRIVSIFLKQLEYYRGVMFLTTNRLSTFDAAFESRIHLSIHYGPLNYESRLHVWRTFLQGGGDGAHGYESELTDKQLELLAKHKLNGRHIKNIVKTSRLLARQAKTPLRLDHVDTVLRVKHSSLVVRGQDFTKAVDGGNKQRGFRALMLNLYFWRSSFRES